MGGDLQFMGNPKDRKYSKAHVWAKLDGDIATCGITDFAQQQLTDILYIDLPEVGKAVEKNKPVTAIESVKSNSDVFSPANGEIAEVNRKVSDNPDVVNKDPLGEGWIFKIKVIDSADLEDLMSADEYDHFIQAEAK
jgi:glycine cleavage system H protein